MEQFEWSESGLQLLAIFKGKIASEGGHFALWSKMRRELRPVLQHAIPVRKAKRSPYKHPHARFVLDNWKEMSVYKMAAMTGMSPAGVSRLSKALRLRNKKYIWNKTGRKPVEKSLVFDTETGIFYFSCAEASRALCINERTFQCYMSGARKWYTRCVRLC